MRERPIDFATLAKLGRANFAPAFSTFLRTHSSKKRSRKSKRRFSCIPAVRIRDARIAFCVYRRGKSAGLVVGLNIFCVVNVKDF